MEKLQDEDASPYVEAKPLVNLSLLARYLNKLSRQGFEINVVSWLSRNATEEYEVAVTNAKLRWLHTHLKSVNFTKIDIIPYGTPKEINRNGFLFDDEILNRKYWKGVAYDVDNIIEILKELPFICYNIYKKEKVM